MTAPSRSTRRFFLGFLIVSLLIAGGLSYFASGDPDGLDSVTLSGCTLDDAGEPVAGECIAQNASDHAMAESPLADYAVGGREVLSGAAGGIGVIVCLVIGTGLFWVLRRRGSPPDEK